MSSMLVALLCVGWFSFAAAWSVHKPAPYALEDANLHFERFIQEYERNYSDEHEKQSRFQIFKAKLEKINSLNAISKHAVYGITQFSDLSDEEMEFRFSSLEDSLDHDSDFDSGCTYLKDSDINYTDAPESWDWREHNAVTPVKEQGACRSYYAFSAIGNIEGQYAIKHKELVRLSEQQIVDCDKNESACNGGHMSVAIRSLIEQGGSMAEADYPYKANPDECHFDANKVKVRITDCRSYKLERQEKLKQLLYHNGPIAIGVKAYAIDSYIHGIIDERPCGVGPINHGALLVGYGSENDVPYWIVKNSWGTSFGENGYFRMPRIEYHDPCGMMNEYMVSAIVA